MELLPQGTGKKENSGVARLPLRFSVCIACMWRDVRSLFRIAFRVVMDGALFSSGCSHPLTNFLGMKFLGVKYCSWGWCGEEKSSSAFLGKEKQQIFSLSREEDSGTLKFQVDLPVRYCSINHHEYPYNNYYFSLIQYYEWSSFGDFDVRHTYQSLFPERRNQRKDAGLSVAAECGWPCAAIRRLSPLFTVHLQPPHCNIIHLLVL